MEFQRWHEMAELSGITMNAWLRRAANERAQLEAALERERRRHEGER